MSKVTAPLLGFGASGQIGKTQVYGTWRGVKYARRYVVPSNPKSAGQTQTRGTFNWINQFWKLLSGEAQATWTLFAKGKPLTDRNALIKSNLAALRGTTADPVTDLSGMILSPGVNGGLVSPSLVLADATGHVITATLTAPALPTSWTITRQLAVAIKQQNAQTDVFYTSVFAEDDTTPYAASLNMGAAGEYQVFSWFEYVKPDGSTAYGPSITHQITIA